MIDIDEHFYLMLRGLVIAVIIFCSPVWVPLWLLGKLYEILFIK